MTLTLDDHSPDSRSLAALTSMRRDDWASTRTEHFSSGINQASLAAVEGAIFHVCSLMFSYKTLINFVSINEKT